MSLYQEVIHISEKHLVGNGKTFIERRLRISLNLQDYETLNIGNLDRLIEGIQLSVEVYLNEEETKRYIKDLLELKKKYYR